MNIQELKDKNLILLECISGSKAYGLDGPGSDTDIKGIYCLPKEDYFGLHYIPQINNETNDIVYYEVGRFIELLLQNNPNILEVLFSPKESILFQHPVFEQIKSCNFLSKLCKNTFGKFAMTQLKKAKSLNKKIVKPFEEERKSILSFCYVTHNQGSMPLLKFLEEKNWDQKNCGLVNIPNMEGLFGLYYSEQEQFKGIIQSKEANEISLSSVPKGMQMITTLYCNKNEYSIYCKEYKEYWNWVKNRNEKRYEKTLEQDKNYDSKNMMHVFRLMNMALEIGLEKEVNVKREDREFLLSIKSGNFRYEELLEMAENKQNEIEIAFENSDLPEKPDENLANKILVKVRDYFYYEKNASDKI